MLARKINMENQSDENCNSTGYRGTGGVSLWDLLTSFSFAVALGGAYGACRCNGQIASIHFWLSLTFGCIIGIFCFWFIRVTGRFMFEFVEKRVKNIRYLNIIFSFIYLWAFAWFIISGMLGALGTIFMWKIF
jgi:hypothetical protein